MTSLQLGAASFINSGGTGIEFVILIPCVSDLGNILVAVAVFIVSGASFVEVAHVRKYVDCRWECLLEELQLGAFIFTEKGMLHLCSPQLKSVY